MQKREFQTPAGGVMTKQVGAITGDVTTWIEDTSKGRVVKIAYTGADESYTVTGGTVAADLDVDQVVTHLSSDPGEDADGNPAAVDVRPL